MTSTNKRTQGSKGLEVISLHIALLYIILSRATLHLTTRISVEKCSDFSREYYIFLGLAVNSGKGHRYNNQAHPQNIARDNFRLDIASNENIKKKRGKPFRKPS